MLGGIFGESISAQIKRRDTNIEPRILRVFCITQLVPIPTPKFNNAIYVITLDKGIDNFSLKLCQLVV
ncbi:hypothetical protein AGMMS49543_13630 [Betaproteobacteria bacterium]|nr:hypothetical protein AGMMS49543_13630 [Betaproteobacteria bacterium]GHU15843.1 hypothetical protein AGMMS50243_00430 [Betaproteobacteria bacterium]